MRVRVHRGCEEVGGSCVEVEHDGYRVVLDVGRPLTAGPQDDVQLPDVAGLADGNDPTLLGVFISHPHLDHYGLVEQVATKVPVYAGAGAVAIVQAARFFSPGSPSLRATGHLVHGLPVRLGPFTITPHLVDHSAYDSYALIVDAGNQRLLYTGDLRGHGRKASLFERMVSTPPVGVDTLLMEGTHVPSSSGDAPTRTAPVTEARVERDLAETLRRTRGLVHVVSSAQNIDRLVTVYRAALRAGRTLVVDLYTATVAQATCRVTIPQPGFPAFGVFVPQRQRVLVKGSGQFDRVHAIRPHRVFPEELAASPEAFVVLAPSSAVGDMLRAGALTDGVVVWSMWEGYLDEPSGLRLSDSLARAGVPIVQHHTSGHASLPDLQRLVKAVAPRQLVPIHTEGADAFHESFGAVARRRDGEWWPVRPVAASTST